MALQHVIERHRSRSTGTRPNWGDPRSYNDKVNWLQVFDQRAEQITCCDKWAVRDWVALRAGPEVLNEAWLGLDERKVPFVAKCSHDSGSARLVRDRFGLDRAREKLGARLLRVYGEIKGEWAYAFVPRQILCEAILPDPTDWKFHCVHGRVAWVQCIWGRETGHPFEAIFLPDGQLTGLLMDDHFRPGVRPPSDGWSELVALAETLAMGWRYVRVDLYWNAKPIFGELTFWPRAGCYGAEMQDVFGELLAIDLTEKREPIVA